MRLVFEGMFYSWREGGTRGAGPNVVVKHVSYFLLVRQTLP